MAKRGTKDPDGYENIPHLEHVGCKKTQPGDEGYVPCYWSKHGHKDPSFGIRAKNYCSGGTRKYREGYDQIEWDR